MLEPWQHLPEHINPIIFQVGFFSVKWYSVMYLVGFAVVYFLLKWRVKNDFRNSQLVICNSDKKNNSNQSPITNHQSQSLILYFIIGLLIGARLAYIIFYNLPYYLAHPLEIIFPVQITNYQLQVTGFYGMSYFGGLIGVIAAGLIFCKKYKINFWQLADFVIPAVPAGYFFGRIGNFLNGELYGRATEKFWGMYFPADPYGLLRHPSQLYEAFFEGIVLFLILWTIRNNKKLTSHFPLLTAYLFGYGFFRFFIEFFREPDIQTKLFFSWLTLGQVFSAIAIITAVFIILIRKKPGISQYAKNGL